ncbi:MAG: ATP-binding protein [Spirochaetota bacterium]|nr:ATP-binding protein [Spirochaetota bacterium]
MKPPEYVVIGKQSGDDRYHENLFQSASSMKSIALLVYFAGLILILVFEYLYGTMRPGLSHLESMFSTTFFAAIVGGLAIYAVYRRFQLTNKRLKEEISGRELAESGSKNSLQLLKAISKAQSQFILDVDSRELFNNILDTLLLSTSSEYGFIGEVLYKPDGSPYLKTHAITNIAWNKETSDFYEENAPNGLEFYNLKSLFGVVMTSGETVIANSPGTDPRGCGIPEGHPPLNAFLGVPFYQGKKLVGMVGVANRPQGYNYDLVDFLEPLLSTCANLIEAYRNDKIKTETESALIDSEARNRALINAIPDMMFRISSEGQLLDFKDMNNCCLIQSKESILNKNIRSLFQKNLYEKVLIHSEKVLETHELQSFEWQYTLMENNKMYYEGRISPSGQNQVLVIIRDITSRKIAEEKQNQLVSDLETANKDLQDFAYIVSHDLKAPLRAIGSLSSWIATDYADAFDDDGREQLDMLTNRVSRMHSLIEGILQYSRVGRVREKVIQVNVRQMIHDILDSLVIPPHIDIQVAEELPEIACEAIRLQQVFMNLVTNSINYMDKDKGKIKISCESKNGHYEFSVSDNGPGIDPKYHQKIFQIFQTLHRKDDIESTGVGLSIVKKIIETFGGQIWLESRPGEHTSFYFTIPKKHNFEQENEYHEKQKAYPIGGR